MVVEDEELLLQAISRKLEKSGIGCISCASAEQAIDYLENMPEMPSAIWLDYYLKDSMDGLQFVQTLKANPTWKNIPILVVSNSANPEKVNALLGLGVKKYFLKAEKRLDDIITEFNQYFTG